MEKNIKWGGGGSRGWGRRQGEKKKGRNTPASEKSDGYQRGWVEGWMKQVVGIKECICHEEHRAMFGIIILYT